MGFIFPSKKGGGKGDLQGGRKGASLEKGHKKAICHPLTEQGLGGKKERSDTTTGGEAGLVLTEKKKKTRPSLSSPREATQTSRWNSIVDGEEKKRGGLAPASATEEKSFFMTGKPTLLSLFILRSQERETKREVDGILPTEEGNSLRGPGRGKEAISFHHHASRRGEGKQKKNTFLLQKGKGGLLLTSEKRGQSACICCSTCAGSPHPARKKNAARCSLSTRASPFEIQHRKNPRREQGHACITERKTYPTSQRKSHLRSHCRSVLGWGKGERDLDPGQKDLVGKGDPLEGEAYLLHLQVGGGASVWEKRKKGSTILEKKGA